MATDWTDPEPAEAEAPALDDWTNPEPVEPEAAAPEPTEAAASTPAADWTDPVAIDPNGPANRAGDFYGTDAVWTPEAQQRVVDDWREPVGEQANDWTGPDDGSLPQGDLAGFGEGGVGARARVSAEQREKWEPRGLERIGQIVKDNYDEGVEAIAPRGEAIRSALDRGDYVGAAGEFIPPLAGRLPGNVVEAASGALQVGTETLQQAGGALGYLNEQGAQAGFSIPTAPGTPLPAALAQRAAQAGVGFTQRAGQVGPGEALNEAWTSDPARRSSTGRLYSTLTGAENQTVTVPNQVPVIGGAQFNVPTADLPDYLVSMALDPTNYVGVGLGRAAGKGALGAAMRYADELADAPFQAVSRIAGNPKVGGVATLAGMGALGLDQLGQRVTDAQGRPILPSPTGWVAEKLPVEYQGAVGLLLPIAIGAGTAGLFRGANIGLGRTSRTAISATGRELVKTVGERAVVVDGYEQRNGKIVNARTGKVDPDVRLAQPGEFIEVPRRLDLPTRYSAGNLALNGYESTKTALLEQTGNDPLAFGAGLRSVIDAVSNDESVLRDGKRLTEAFNKGVGMTEAGRTGEIGIGNATFETPEARSAIGLVVRTVREVAGIGPKERGNVADFLSNVMSKRGWTDEQLAIVLDDMVTNKVQRDLGIQNPKWASPVFRYLGLLDELAYNGAAKEALITAGVNEAILTRGSREALRIANGAKGGASYRAARAEAVAALTKIEAGWKQIKPDTGGMRPKLPDALDPKLRGANINGWMDVMLASKAVFAPLQLILRPAYTVANITTDTISAAWQAAKYGVLPSSKNIEIAKRLGLDVEHSYLTGQQRGGLAGEALFDRQPNEKLPARRGAVRLAFDELGYQAPGGRLVAKAIGMPGRLVGKAYEGATSVGLLNETHRRQMLDATLAVAKYRKMVEDGYAAAYQAMGKDLLTAAQLARREYNALLSGTPIGSWANGVDWGQVQDGWRADAQAMASRLTPEEFGVQWPEYVDRRIAPVIQTLEALPQSRAGALIRVLDAESGAKDWMGTIQQSNAAWNEILDDVLEAYGRNEPFVWPPAGSFTIVPPELQRVSPEQALVPIPARQGPPPPPEMQVEPKEYPIDRRIAAYRRKQMRPQPGQPGQPNWTMVPPEQQRVPPERALVPLERPLGQPKPAPKRLTLAGLADSSPVVEYLNEKPWSSIRPKDYPELAKKPIPVAGLRPGDQVVVEWWTGDLVEGTIADQPARFGRYPVQFEDGSVRQFFAGEQRARGKYTLSDNDGVIVGKFRESAPATPEPVVAEPSPARPAAVQPDAMPPVDVRRDYVRRYAEAAKQAGLDAEIVIARMATNEAFYDASLKPLGITPDEFYGRLDVRFEPGGQPGASARTMDVRPDFREPVIRGWQEISPEGRFVEVLTSNANRATVLHEGYHTYQRFMEMFPDQFTEPLRVLREAYGDDTELPARAFERYVSEGKAPTPALEAVFKQIAEWMASIYRKIVGSEIDVPLTNEVRQTFQQLLGGPAFRDDVRLRGKWGAADSQRQIWNDIGARLDAEQGRPPKTESAMPFVERAVLDRIGRELGVDPKLIREEIGVDAGTTLANAYRAAQAKGDMATAQRLARALNMLGLVVDQYAVLPLPYPTVPRLKAGKGGPKGSPRVDEGLPRPVAVVRMADARRLQTVMETQGMAAYVKAAQAADVWQQIYNEARQGRVPAAAAVPEPKTPDVLDSVVRDLRRPIVEMTPDERAYQIAFIQKEYAAQLATPLFGEGALSPTQFNRMGKRERTTYQQNAEVKLMLQERIRDLQLPQETLDRQAMAGQLKEIDDRLTGIASMLETFETVGKAKRGGLKPSYQREADKLIAEREQLTARRDRLRGAAAGPTTPLNDQRFMADQYEPDRSLLANRDRLQAKPPVPEKPALRSGDPAPYLGDRRYQADPLPNGPALERAATLVAPADLNVEGRRLSLGMAIDRLPEPIRSQPTLIANAVRLTENLPPEAKGRTISDYLNEQLDRMSMHELAAGRTKPSQVLFSDQTAVLIRDVAGQYRAFLDAVEARNRLRADALAEAGIDTRAVRDIQDYRGVLDDIPDPYRPGWVLEDGTAYAGRGAEGQPVRTTTGWQTPDGRPVRFTNGMGWVADELSPSDGFRQLAEDIKARGADAVRDTAADPNEYRLRIDPKIRREIENDARVRANREALEETRMRMFGYDDRSVGQNIIDHFAPYPYWTLQTIGNIAPYFARRPGQFFTLMSIMRDWAAANQGESDSDTWSVFLWRAPDGTEVRIRPLNMLFPFGQAVGEIINPFGNEDRDWARMLRSMTSVFGASPYVPIEQGAQLATTLGAGGVTDWLTGERGESRAQTLTSQGQLINRIIRATTGIDFDPMKGYRQAVYGDSTLGAERYFGGLELARRARDGEITVAEARQALLDAQEGRQNPVWDSAMQAAAGEQAKIRLATYMGVPIDVNLAQAERGRQQNLDYFGAPGQLPRPDLRLTAERDRFVEQNPDMSVRWMLNDDADKLRYGAAADDIRTRYDAAQRALGERANRGEITGLAWKAERDKLRAAESVEWTALGQLPRGRNLTSAPPSVPFQADDAAALNAFRAIAYDEKNPGRQNEQRVALLAQMPERIREAVLAAQYANETDVERYYRTVVRPVENAYYAIPQYRTGTPEQQERWERAYDAFNEAYRASVARNNGSTTGASAYAFNELARQGLSQQDYEQARANRSNARADFLKTPEGASLAQWWGQATASGTGSTASAGTGQTGGASRTGTTTTAGTGQNARPGGGTTTGAGTANYRTFFADGSEYRQLQQSANSVDRAQATLLLAQNYDSLVASGWRPTGERPDLRKAELSVERARIFETQPRDQGAAAYNQWLADGNAVRLNALNSQLGITTRYPEYSREQLAIVDRYLALPSGRPRSEFLTANPQAKGAIDAYFAKQGWTGSSRIATPAQSPSQSGSSRGGGGGGGGAVPRQTPARSMQPHDDLPMFLREASTVAEALRSGQAVNSTVLAALRRRFPFGVPLSARLDDWLAVVMNQIRQQQAA